ncbi:MAG: hypothetical protein QG604_749 [Candidatus Dependentiae bacterium]|nr:hypothetical protein [Candidatus Dependentiae bacterium]
MYSVRHKVLKSFLVLCIVSGGGWLSADDFVERKIAITPQLAPGKSAPIYQVGELSLFTLRKAVLSPPGGSPIFVAPYYYAAEVAWYNADGTPQLISGKQVMTTVYLAVVFDGSRWVDVSGVGLATDGRTRMWIHGDNYLVCVKYPSGAVALQAFATGGNETSIAYDAVAIGAGNVPKPYPISSFDCDILMDPCKRLAFDISNPENAPIIGARANGYVSPQPVVGSYTISNTLAAVSVATATAATVAVTIGTTTYNLPQSMIYQVMNPLMAPITVKQYWLNKLSHDGISASSSGIIPQPHRIFVPTSFGMKLADYYLAVSGATPTDTTFIALSLTSPVTATVPAFSAWKNTTAGLALSADATSISIQGGAFFDPALNPSGQIYVDGLAYPVTADKQESLRSSYLALVGVSDSDQNKQKKIDKDRQDLYQQLQLSYDASGFVIAASAKFFGGQCAFYMRPLNKVTVLAREEVQIFPLNAMVLAESAFYALGKEMSAVLEDGIDTSIKNFKTTWANPSDVGAMIQVKFLTADHAVSYDGVLLIPSGFVVNPPPYYDWWGKDARESQFSYSPFQYWCSSPDGIVVPVSLDRDSPTAGFISRAPITGIAIANDAEVGVLPANVKKSFTDKAHAFWGLTPYKAAGGMSTAQKVGQGFAYAGLATAGALAVAGLYKYAQYRKNKVDSD